MKRSFKLFAAGAAAAALIVAPSAVSAQDEEPSIAEIAVGNDDFSTLVEAATAAGLVDLLSDCSQEFTVFAPTNDAFAALPEELLAAALADTELLTAVLTYHVVPGTVTSDALPESATTVQGEAITISGTTLNGSVNVVATDIMACNGVVHVIDGVLLPPSLTDAPAEEAPAEEAPAEPVTDLPATGVNNLTAGLAAAALLAAGFALIGASRRRITV